MCRFSASLAPPAGPEEQTIDSFLDDDAANFSWFDAIDCIDDAIEPAVPGLGASGSTGFGNTQAGSAPPALTPSGSGSDTSSTYDLVEMFKQQVEQQQQQPVGLPSAPFVAAPVGAPVAAHMLMSQQQMMCGVAGPFAGACMAPAFLPLAGAAAGTGVLNNTVGTPAVPMASIEAASAPSTSAMPCHSGSAAAPSSSCGRRGSRGQKTQEEIDAAVERIKQKRRESAQRSRARKNDYMHQLERENQALKDEVQRLQQVLAAVQRSTFQQQQAAALVQLGGVVM